MRFLATLLLFSLLLLAKEKSPSDVFTQSIILKNMLITLRAENNILRPLKTVLPQNGKTPRHVLQKTLEILTKINKYREINNYGLISVPPVPPRDITPQDVYNNVKRLSVEVSFLLKESKVLKASNTNKPILTNKTPSDVYRELWQISLGFDELLEQGFTPTDVYLQSQQIIELIQFLRTSQRIYTPVEIPKKRKKLHPNHALYASIELLKHLHNIEKKLWMKSVPIPQIEQRVISPTEVYDSLQTVKAELTRISQRLGLEKNYSPLYRNEKKTPADVVQNLEYASNLLPNFSFTSRLNQYPVKSLIKTPNDVYALSQFILQKIFTIKDKQGIQINANKAPFVFGLKPIHVYVKGLENLEKVAKLRELEGFHTSEIPTSANTKITPSEVYELILRLDDEINIIYNRKSTNYNLLAYREYKNKHLYHDKTPSDVYNVLWNISYELDTILNQEYTPNETYILAQKIANDITTMHQFFLTKSSKLEPRTYTNKRPQDVYNESLKLMENLQSIKQRANIESVAIVLPKEQNITPTSVYNSLRIISGTISEIYVNYAIEYTHVTTQSVKNKTPSDVYEQVNYANRLLSNILEDTYYEN